MQFVFLWLTEIQPNLWNQGYRVQIQAVSIYLLSTVWAMFFRTFELSVFIFPTDTSTILELRDQEIDELYVLKKRRTTDLKAPKL